jgi:hypothetical protein
MSDELPGPRRGAVLSAEVYEPDEALPRDLVALRRFASLMDNAIPIPGTKKGIGLDPILGLIPGVGDALSALFSTWILLGALRHRVPGRKILRMVVNIGIDLVVGLIPILGDIFDVFFTENLANVEMIVRHRNRRLPPRGYGSIAFVFALIFIAIALVCVAIVLWLIVGLIEFSRSLG